MRRGGVADGSGIGEDALHPLVGGKRLVLADADGGEQAAGFWVDRVERLFLDNGCHVLKKRSVGGGDGAEDERRRC